MLVSRDAITVCKDAVGADANAGYEHSCPGSSDLIEVPKTIFSFPDLTG
jgi:hypothetical protein